MLTLCNAIRRLLLFIQLLIAVTRLLLTTSLKKRYWFISYLVTNEKNAYFIRVYYFYSDPNRLRSQKGAACEGFNFYIRIEFHIDRAEHSDSEWSI